MNPIQLQSTFNTLIQNNEARKVSRWVNHGRRIGHPARLHLAGASVVQVSPANPTDAPLVNPNLPLYASGGPVITDINQGVLSDCYMLAFLAALCQTANGRAWIQNRCRISSTNPNQVVVSFTRNGIQTDVSMDFLEDTQAARDSTSIWPEAMEKAYAFYRTGADTFASINMGLASAFASDFGCVPSGINLNQTAATTAAALLADLNAGKPCTLMSPASPGLGLVGSHCYTVMGVGPDGSVTLRNPWGATAGTLIYVIPPAGLIQANLSYYEYGTVPPITVPAPVNPPIPVPASFTPKAVAAVATLPATILASQFTALYGSVKVENNTPDGSADLGYIQSGDQASALVNVATQRTFNLAFKCASVYPTFSFDVYAGTIKLGTVSGPGTGSWSVYQTIPLGSVQIPVGLSYLTLFFTSGAVNVNNVTVS